MENILSPSLEKPLARKTDHSVLSWQIWVKGSYLDQKVPQHESLYPKGLKPARIETPNIGFHYKDFSKTDFYKYKNSFTVIPFKLILLTRN